ncbi:biotin/lipoyl-containing protein [Albimonas donghaensis]|nr:biotin/lipoyl-containing protein [Albimonas donghaensis]
MQPDGTSGPGVRVDGAGYGGYAPSPHYDSLVAKVIVQGRGDFARVAERVYRALGQFRLEGAPSNLPFLMNLLRMEEVRANAVDIGFVDAHAAALAAPGEGRPVLFAGAGAAAEDGPALDGPALGGPALDGPAGTRPVVSPLTGVVAERPAAPGEAVREGAPVAVLEAMKMQHVVTAPFSGILRAAPGIGDRVDEGAPLAFLEPAEIEGAGPEAAAEIDLDHIRPDLAGSLARHRQGLDEGRPAAVEKRRAKGKRTARENVADLCDPRSFVEYGALAVAAQRSRHPEELLREISPADGLVAGVGAVNGALLDAEKARCAVMV